MKVILYSFLYLIVFCTSLSAQEAMTLEKAIQIALEHNFDIKIAETSIRIAEQNNSWARAGKGPTVDLNGVFSNNLINDNNPASFLNGTFYNGTLGASLDGQWVLYNGGRVAIAKDQLGLAVEQSMLSKQSGIHELMLAVYQNYYTVLLQQERLEVLRESLKLSKDRLAYEKVKKEFGASNSFNFIQFETAIISDSTNMQSQIVQVDQAKRNLYNVLDVMGMQDYSFPEKLSVNVEEIDRQKLEDILSEENYTLKSLQMIAELNTLNTTLESAARKPTISVNGSLGASESAFKFFEEDPTTGNFFKLLWSNRLNVNLGANLNWNLYDGGLRKDNIQAAKMQEELDQLSVMQAKADLINQLDILIANYENQKELLNLSDEQIKISKKNLEMTSERLKAGQITSLDFRNVQNQYLNAAFGKVSAIYNLILTKSEIDFLVGTFE